MKQHLSDIIFLHGLEKSPIFDPTEIASRFCSSAGFWGTGLQGEHPGRERDKAFRNPALCAVAIPSWPANPGLCSSRAVAASSPAIPATSLSLCAVFALAGQSNSLSALSPLATVTGTLKFAVFTRTQTTHGFCIFPLAVWTGNVRNSSK
jgi:hypothetical protein